MAQALAEAASEARVQPLLILSTSTPLLVFDPARPHHRLGVAADRLGRAFEHAGDGALDATGLLRLRNFTSGTAAMTRPISGRAS